MKTIRTIAIDTEVDLAIRNKPDFNVSQFCNEALRQALNIKSPSIPKDEKKIDMDIVEKRIELQMLEQKKKELEEKRKKEKKKEEEEKKRWVVIDKPKWEINV